MRRLQAVTLLVVNLICFAYVSAVLVQAVMLANGWLVAWQFVWWLILGWSSVRMLNYMQTRPPK
jgi:hypothetical protein